MRGYKPGRNATEAERRKLRDYASTHVMEQPPPVGRAKLLIASVEHTGAISAGTHEAAVRELVQGETAGVADDK